MPSQKQDYLLRLIEELGRLVTEIVKLRNQGSYDAALHTLLQAQERLFSRPAEEFVGRPIEDQVNLLVRGENPANAREKCLLYATLLAEAASTYQARDQAALALGACRWALHVLLLARQESSDADSSALRARLGALLDQLPTDDHLAQELKDLLRQLAAPSRAADGINATDFPASFPP